MIKDFEETDEEGEFVVVRKGEQLTNYEENEYVMGIIWMDVARMNEFAMLN